MADAGWLPDPTGRFQLRYWDGDAWTQHVAQHGVPATDPAGLLAAPLPQNRRLEFRQQQLRFKRERRKAGRGFLGWWDQRRRWTRISLILGTIAIVVGAVVVANLVKDETDPEYEAAKTDCQAEAVLRLAENYPGADLKSEAVIRVAAGYFNACMVRKMHVDPNDLPGDKPYIP